MQHSFLFYTLYVKKEKAKFLIAKIAKDCQLFPLIALIAISFFSLCFMFGFMLLPLSKFHSTYKETKENFYRIYFYQVSFKMYDYE